MNRGELRDELYDLGHHYLQREPGRADRFLDQAARDVLLFDPWPQRTTSDPFDATVVLPTLGTILQVWDTQTGLLLTPTTAQEDRDANGAEPADIGPPCEYWVVRNEQILTRPALAPGLTVTVEHRSKGVWVDNGARFASAPRDQASLIGAGIFDEAVLLGARLRALEDTDETGLRDSITARQEQELIGLRDRELNVIADEPTRIKQTQDLA